jgi:hypothetical protein
MRSRSGKEGITQSSQRRIGNYGNPEAAKMQDGSRGIFVYTCGHQASREPVKRLPESPMAIFSRITVEAVKWRARRGLNADADSLSGVKQGARQRGVRGETFAYRYLRRLICFRGANYVPRDKGH